jgi:hypothetical protein
MARAKHYQYYSQKKIRRRQTIGFQSGDMLNAEESQYFDQLEHLWDMLSDCIEGGRLTEADIPDDYKALVKQMVKLGNLEYKATKQLEKGN